MSKVTVINHTESGKPMCSARLSSWSPENPRTCHSVILCENGRCKKHGGMTPKGVASVHFRTGRHSRHLPTRLAEKYEERLQDAELHTLEHEIALCDARIADLLESVDQGGGSTQIFGSIRDALAEFKYAAQDGDRDGQRTAMRKLTEEVAKGSHEGMAWREVHALVDQRRKLVMAEAKRLQLTGQFISVERVNILFGVMLDIIRAEFPDDRKKLNRIADRFLQLAQGSQSQRQLVSAPVQAEEA